MESSSPVLDRDVQPGQIDEHVPLSVSLDSYHSFGALADASARREEDRIEEDVHCLEEGVSGVQTLGHGASEEQQDVTGIGAPLSSEDSTGDCSEGCVAAQHEDGGHLHSDECTTPASTALDSKSDEHSSSYGDDDRFWEDVTTLTHTSETCGRLSTIHIIGTAHVSQASCDQVARLIHSVKPEAVFLELCQLRTSLLRPEKLKVPTFTEMLHALRSKRMTALEVVCKLFLGKVASKLEVVPGAEFRVAYEEAKAYGAHVTLGDRPLQVTLLRAWRMMSFKEKAWYIPLMVVQSMFLPRADDLRALVEKMKDTDCVTQAIQAFGQSLPTVARTFIDERDQYMAARIRTTADRYSSVVAVVGKGHVAGIVQNWNERISEVQLESLLVVPPLKPAKTPWGLLALSAGGLTILSGAYLAYRRRLALYH